MAPSYEQPSGEGPPYARPPDEAPPWEQPPSALDDESDESPPSALDDESNEQPPWLRQPSRTLDPVHLYYPYQDGPLRPEDQTFPYDAGDLYVFE